MMLEHGLLGKHSSQTVSPLLHFIVCFVVFTPFDQPILYFPESFFRTSFELLLILPILAAIDRQDALYVILEQVTSFKRIEAMLTFRFR